MSLLELGSGSTVNPTDFLGKVWKLSEICTQREKRHAITFSLKILPNNINNMETDHFHRKRYAQIFCLKDWMVTLYRKGHFVKQVYRTTFPHLWLGPPLMCDENRLKWSSGTYGSLEKFISVQRANLIADLSRFNENLRFSKLGPHGQPLFATMQRKNKINGNNSGKGKGEHINNSRPKICPLINCDCLYYFPGQWAVHGSNPKITLQNIRKEHTTTRIANLGLVSTTGPQRL